VGKWYGKMKIVQILYKMENGKMIPRNQGGIKEKMEGVNSSMKIFDIL
jgi:hypothetical protein